MQLEIKFGDSKIYYFGSENFL